MDKNTKTALIIGGVIIAILIVVPLVYGLFGGWQGNSYGNNYGYGMMGSGMMGGFGIGGGFMFIPMILFGGLIIWGIVALARGAGGASCAGSGSYPATKDSAIDILKSRYARGEIKKAEFEERKKDLV